MSQSDYILQSQKILLTISTISAFASKNIGVSFVNKTIVDELYVQIQDLNLSIFNIQFSK